MRYSATARIQSTRARGVATSPAHLSPCDRANGGDDRRGEGQVNGPDADPATGAWRSRSGLNPDPRALAPPRLWTPGNDSESTAPFGGAQARRDRDRRSPPDRLATTQPTS